MKLLVILSRFPYPLEKGDKLRAYHQLKQLSKKHKIYLVCLTDQSVDKRGLNEIQKICEEVHVFRLNRFLIYWNTAKQFFTEKPFQVGYFYQRSMQRKINNLIKVIEPQHIYCQLVRTAEYVKNIQHIKKTIDYMDALSKGMYRRAEISKGIKRRFFTLEGKRLSEYENRIFDFFDYHTIISEQDRKFIYHTQATKITVIENGIDESFFEDFYQTEKKYDLIFVGNMNYPPNVEAADFLVKQILPILHQKNPQINLLISGANPQQRVLNLASDKVTVTGWIDDIRESYASAKIFVAPLFIGTGLQNKLLEAMAMGVPCVTTSLVNNALGAINNQSILLAQNATDFAQQIESLFSQKEIYHRISDEAKKYVQITFSWEKSCNKLNQLWENG